MPTNSPMIEPTMIANTAASLKKILFKSCSFEAIFWRAKQATPQRVVDAAP